MKGKRDAVSVIMNDHRTLQLLFRRFDRALSQVTSLEEIDLLAREILQELATHTAMEEQVLYPRLREVDGVQEPLVLVSLEQHHVGKLLLDELDAMNPADERFIPKLIVLAESTLEHMADEEHDLLPQIKRQLSRDELNALGDDLLEARSALGQQSLFGPGEKASTQPVPREERRPLIRRS